MKYEKETLLWMFRTITVIRKFEEKAMDLYLKGKLPGFLHSSIGQEAIPTGVSACLRDDDYIVSTHRGHGDILAKGTTPDRMMAELYGKTTGYCKGKGGSMHIADLDLGILGATGIVGGGLPIVNGAALAAKLRGTDQVAVCYFGDGASNEGTFHEAVNMAAIWDLPVLFVCHFNMYAESTPSSYHQKVEDLSLRAKGYGIPGVSVDGNDTLAVYEAAKKAVDRARKGKGPTLMNCRTYRILGHYVGDSGEQYRSKEEVEEAKKRDPINILRKNLIEMDVLTEEKAKKIEAEIDKQMDDAVAYAQQSPSPTADDLMTDVYSE